MRKPVEELAFLFVFAIFVNYPFQAASVFVCDGNALFILTKPVCKLKRAAFEKRFQNPLFSQRQNKKDSIILKRDRSERFSGTKSPCLKKGLMAEARKVEAEVALEILDRGTLEKAQCLTETECRC